MARPAEGDDALASTMRIRMRVLPLLHQPAIDAGELFRRDYRMIAFIGPGCAVGAADVGAALAGVDRVAGPVGAAADGAVAKLKKGTTGEGESSG
eukprot:5204944-Pleurochrysis_carterae.AAC.1